MAFYGMRIWQCENNKKGARVNYVLLLLLGAMANAIGCIAQLPDEFVFSFSDLVSQIKVVNSEIPIIEDLDAGSQALRFPILDQKSVFNGLTAKTLASKLSKINESAVSTAHCRAEISYLFADLKYDGEQLKILELGEGKNGGFRSFDAIFEEGRIWKGFWNYITSLGLPVFYVGPGPSNDPINKIGISLNQKIAWSDFMEKSGLWEWSLYDLKELPDFKALATAESSGDGSGLLDYKAIIVYKYRDDREPTHLRALEKFKKDYPNFLVLDCVSRPFAASKQLNDLLFRSSEETAVFRPACKLYPKRYETGLDKKILNDIGGEFFVIKPVDSGMSNGVIMTSRELLDMDLRRILSPRMVSSDSHPTTFNYRPTDTQSYSYWIGDTNKQFIVEAFAPSRTITVLGKKYDPTIRVVFALVHDKDAIKVKFFEHWWKLPPKALDEYSILTLKHVSQYRPDLKELPAKELTLSDEDERGMRSLMAGAMARAYVKMLLLENDKA
jgi:hypothetical protein